MLAGEADADCFSTLVVSRFCRKKNNEALPATQEEMMAMQGSDPRLRAIGIKM
jgi:hypothetical protein